MLCAQDPRANPCSSRSCAHRTALLRRAHRFSCSRFDRQAGIASFDSRGGVFEQPRRRFDIRFPAAADRIRIEPYGLLQLCNRRRHRRELGGRHIARALLPASDRSLGSEALRRFGSRHRGADSVSDAAVAQRSHVAVLEVPERMRTRTDVDRERDLDEHRER